VTVVIRFLIRFVLIAGGLLFTAALAAAGVLMLAFWGVRSAWAKVTGRPVMPFIIRIDPRAGFDRMYRTAQGTAASGTDSFRRRSLADVADVEARPLQR
jgi:hypothetical protein